MIPQLNDTVRIPSLTAHNHAGTGTVTHIDYAHLFAHDTYPIQVTLDTPISRCSYDAAQVWRTNTKDIEIIERGNADNG